MEHQRRRRRDATVRRLPGNGGVAEEGAEEVSEPMDAPVDQPGAIIGASAYLEPGVTENMVLSLMEGEEVVVGDVLYAMLHTDDGDKEWNGEVDTPITNDDGEIVMVRFMILAEEDLPGFDVKL